MSGRHLVEKLTQRLVALALVAHFGCGDAARARADVGGAVLLTRVIQVARLGCVEAVVLLSQSRVTFRREEKRNEEGIAFRCLILHRLFPPKW